MLCRSRRLDHSWSTFYSLLAKLICLGSNNPHMGNDLSHREMCIFIGIFIYDILWDPRREKCASHSKSGMWNVVSSEQRNPCSVSTTVRGGESSVIKNIHGCFPRSVVQNLHGHGRIVLIKTQPGLCISGLIGSSWEQWEANSPHLDAALLSVGGRVGKGPAAFPGVGPSS